MSRDYISNADLVRQTCELVAAYCQNLPIEPAELPALIAYVGAVLSMARSAEARTAAAHPRPKPRAGQISAAGPAAKLVDFEAYRRARTRGGDWPGL